MTGIAAIAVALQAVAAPPASASPPPAAAGAEFSLPFGPVPAEIDGVPCRPLKGHGDFAPSLLCDPAKPMEQPTINLSVADWRSHPSRAELIAHMREAFHERTIFNVIREEPFAPPGDPEAVGFRAYYQTEFGNRYVWAVLTRGKLIRVIAAVFAPTDLEALKGDVELKVFAVAAAPVAPRKDK